MIDVLTLQADYPAPSVTGKRFVKLDLHLAVKTAMRTRERT